MVTKILKAFYVVLFTALVGCSTGLEVKTDDPGDHFDTFKTYAWHDKTFTPTDELSKASYVFVNDLIEKKLANKGYSKASDNKVDFYVSYSLVAEDVVDVKQVNVYSGYGKGFTWYGEDGFANEVYLGGKEVEINEMIKGSLILDIIDADTDTLVWRGTADKKLEARLSKDEREKVLTSAISKLFQWIPVSSK